jgi:hypothetical protein
MRILRPLLPFSVKMTAWPVGRLAVPKPAEHAAVSLLGSPKPLGPARLVTGGGAIQTPLSTFH